MPRRETFGGASDWSDTFASLAREDLARAQAATRDAVARAEADQAAKDNDVFSQWKNGEITDEAWLAYIGTRISDTAGDPEENQKWKDALREHTAAISDAKAEADYAMGTITLGALMSHYQSRMGGVQKNSPAWRELATRYAQLSDAAATSSRGGGGGGGGGGGDGTGTNLSDLPAGSYGNDAGPVDPTNLFMETVTVGDYLDGLFADRDRIDDLMRQLKDNPNAQYLTDPLTGETFQPTPDMIRAIDAQYLRTGRQISGAKWMIGDRDGAINAMVADGKYISTTMRDHNDMAVEPLVSEFEQTSLDMLHAASSTGDPNDYSAALKQVGQNANNLLDGLYPGEGGIGLKQFVTKTRIQKGADPENGVTGGTTNVRHDLPEEYQVHQNIVKRVEAWTLVAQIGTDQGMTPREIEDMANTIFEGLGGEGGMSQEDITALLQGEIDPANPNGGLIGAETHRHHIEGLNAGADPGFAGVRFTHQLTDDGRVVIVPGELHQNPTTEQFTVVPKDSDVTGQARVAVNVNGRITVAWATPKPVEVPGYMVVVSDRAFTEYGVSVEAGGYIPSSVLAKWGKGRIAAAIRNGAAHEQSRLDGVVMPGGSVWFWDEATNTFFPSDPVAGAPHIAKDKDALGYANVGDDGQPTGAHLSGARGYPVAYDAYVPGRPAFDQGIKPEQMQSWLEARILDGTIDPTDYTEFGVDGVAGAALDMTDLYYTPPLRERHGAKGLTPDQRRSQSISDRDEQARQQRVGDWIKNEVTPFYQEWRKFDSNMDNVSTESVADFGKSLGINLGGTPTGPGGGGPGRGRKPQGPHLTNPVVTRDNALASAAARARLAEQRAIEPRLLPLPAYKAPLKSADPMPVRPPVRAPLPKRTLPLPKPPVRAPLPNTSTYSKQREG